MKVVTFLVALLMSLSMTASLFAAENKGKNDVDLIFQSSQTTAIAQPLELALLSEKEMAETEGEWVGFAVRFAYAGYKVWQATKRGTKIYNRGWHKPHHNFGTKSRPSWRKHYQWTTSQGNYRVPYGPNYLYKNRPDLGSRRW